MSHQSYTLSFDQESSSALDALESLLIHRLPYSLPLLRRIQFSRRRGSPTEHGRVVFVSLQDLATYTARKDEDVKFTAAYINVSGGPETQMWLFSTLEAEESPNPADDAIYTTQLDIMISSVSRLARLHGKPLTHGNAVLLGTLNSRVKRLLEGKFTPRETGLYDKWLFRAEDLPGTEGDGDLEEGMVWDVARERDLEVAVSRTDIPRTP